MTFTYGWVPWSSIYLVLAKRSQQNENLFLLELVRNLLTTFWRCRDPEARSDSSDLMPGTTSFIFTALESPTAGLFWLAVCQCLCPLLGGTLYDLSPSKTFCLSGVPIPEFLDRGSFAPKYPSAS
ncbi:hypothetical protein BDR03DRAFT_959407, partial [Suillus americanus]